MSFDQASLDDLATRYTAAWNTRVPENVAAFHAPTSRIIINNGEPSEGHDGITEMAAGFHAAVPDLALQNDGIRGAGDHVVYMWTFKGHDANTGHPLCVSGWEEWELDGDMKVASARGWFDAENYQRQIDGL
ncbi:nuclear transport factor 2 family protein [Thalassospiraceae bacterium LMO-JJ14]|nr:nuclear transport factor 2 family protein [Thalassospiraceae bacterium LMO-JJ14]